MQNESCASLVKLPAKRVPDLNYSFLAQRVDIINTTDVYTVDLHSTRLVYFTEELPTLNTEEFPIFAGRSLIIDFNSNTKYETKVGEDCWIIYITDKSQLIEDYYNKKVNLCKQYIGKYLGYRTVNGVTKPAYAVSFNSLSVSSGDLSTVLADVFHITFDPYFFTVDILTDGVVAIDGQTIYNRATGLHHRKCVRIKTETIDPGYITSDTVFRAEDNDPYTDIILQYPTGGYTGGGSSSIWLTGSSIFNITGSPVTGSGTFTINLATETANYGFYGPTSGGADTPTFRAMVTNDITNNIVTDAKLRQSAALSVIGRSANSTGNVADISASAGTSYVLIESGSTLIWGQTQTATYANSSVTYAKIQNMTTARVLGRTTAGSGVIEELNASGGIAFSAGYVTTTGAITSTNFTMSTNRILGRTTAGTGAIEQLSGAGGITFTAGTITTSGSITATGFTCNTNKLLGRYSAGSGAIQEMYIGSGLTLTSDTISASGTTSPGGSPKQIQYNLAGAFAGGTGFEYTAGANHTVTIWGQDSLYSGLQVNAFSATDINIQLVDGYMDFQDGVNIAFGTSTGTKIGETSTQKLAFWGATPIVQPTVTGSRGGNAALADLLTKLANAGIIVDATT